MAHSDLDTLSDVDMSNPHRLLSVLRELRDQVHKEGLDIFSRWKPAIERDSFLFSGMNLAYYLALRQHDLTLVQAALMPLGLSSLGRIEARVLHNLDAVIATLGAICGHNPVSRPNYPSHSSYFYGEELLNHNAAGLFGPERPGRRIRIMVTMPSEAATNYELVRDLCRQGMDCMRINCAYDTPDNWQAMIDNLRRAETETGCASRVAMDLAGPKVRTGQVSVPNDPDSPGKSKRLFKGDTLLLTRDKGEASPAPADELYLFQATCTIPNALDHLVVGEHVWIDDGKIGLIVEQIMAKGFSLRVTDVGPRGGKLRPGKGLNLPDTTLSLSPLTEKDLGDLDFVAVHADIVSYSFVREPEDIDLLQAALRERAGDKARDIAIIAKIETGRAVLNLPELIVRAAGKQPLGVMIARGDLAVEIGYQRLAEMQEEIMWLCEAAHVPVIWATQVLENLVHNGIPTRAEITDAAMSERAECVMLNKGPFLVEAVTILGDVLSRMQRHQTKKTSHLHALHTWTR